MLENTSSTFDTRPPPASSNVNVYEGSVWYWFDLCVACVLAPLLCLTSVICNTLSASIFYRHGLRHSTNVSLFYLSVSDFMNSIITGVALSLSMLKIIKPRAPVVVAGLQSMFFWPRTMFSDLSMYITLVISLNRCLCIAMPIRVKTLITYRRTNILLVTCTVFALASYLPIFASYGLQWKWSDGENRTVLGVWYAESRAQIESFSHIFTSIIMASWSQLTILVCAVFMYRGLKKSCQLKKRQGQDEAQTLGQKERAVVKTVFLIAIVLVVTMLPQLAFAFALRLIPQFSVFGDLLMAWGYFNKLLSIVNATINFFIYYRYNTKFRKTLREIFTDSKVSGE